MSRLGKRLIASVKKARANLQAGGILRVHVPADVDAKKIRQRLHMSQSVFAARFGIPEGTLKDWEQRRRKPEGPARAYLMVIARNPDAVRRALENSAPW
jgi:putative transcriptional regulator